MSHETTIRVVLTDGTEHRFSMETPVDNGPDYSVGSKLQRLLSMSSLAFAVDDELLIIPMQQVKSLHITPIEGKLPETVVANVRRLPKDGEPETLELTKAQRKESA
ncbi:hypothetical protein [Rubinisphaera brasiliensis]|uniref:Uncharacterized protein n=1 Tax=Rubinisphaera brasiliensis (strain ATCC 49424 / DSM 5305 / JCM 21570 / IAM 15109 / NBRC 103401 / IFAM 1448) TaxID=756272 RepID=F0SJ17_RUBBR|nr:hypothetical protein [Rubinisphaera brasiliensis]ADY58559.1 hypothetical protein Plabr_0938 [Rubinisphaera brasiliensis DSM 5305]